MDDEPNYTRILQSIEACQDFHRLMTFAANAQKKNVPVVYDAVLAKLNALTPSYKEGSLEFEFWVMFAAYQNVLLLNMKPAFKLYETWKLAHTEGETHALRDWVENLTQSWAFQYFETHDMLDRTAESLVLRFPEKFASDLYDQAKKRIDATRAQMMETT